MIRDSRPKQAQLRIPGFRRSRSASYDRVTIHMFVLATVRVRREKVHSDGRSYRISKS